MSRKTEYIALRLTEDERAIVDRMAMLCCCNVSEALRKLVRNTKFETVATITPVATINIEDERRGIVSRFEETEKVLA